MDRPMWTVLLVAALTACGEGGGEAGGDGPGPGPDGDGAAPIDAGPADAGIPVTCGDADLDPGEVCDGDVVTCASLGASWTAGMASCRADCAGRVVSACTAGNGAQYEVVKPAARDPRWAEARCNDGTPFAFDLRLAPTPSSRWVIYLQGGVYCDDASFPCSTRAPALTTTVAEADRALASRTLAGLFSRGAGADPAFAGANQVRAHYCSSDFWAGATTTRRPSSGSPQGWYFSGRANVAALVGVLRERYGLADDDPATEVLFSGGSAGAFGAHFNAAQVAAALPATTTRGDLRLFVDAGWLTDWDDPAYRLGAATAADRDVWRGARTFWGAAFDPACEAAVADPSSCLFGPVWAPHVAARMPLFVSQSSIDSSFTGVHGLTSGPALAAWRAQVEQSLAGVAWLHSGDTAYHVQGTTEAGMGSGPPGSTLRQTLGRFWRDGPAERVEF